MPRGGKRPGAGAPKGNLNALKHGRYSQQFAKVGALMAADPKLRAHLFDIADRVQLKQQKASEIALVFLAATYEQGRRSRGGLNQKGPSHVSDSINDTARLLLGGQHENLTAEALQPANRKTSPGHNQKPRTDPESQSDPDTKSH